MKRRVVYLIGVMIFFLSCGEALAQTSIKISGMAQIPNYNIAKAREDAISNALMSAVSVKALELISAQDAAKNFQKINEMISSRAKDFVETYKVLTEACVGKNCQVLVEAGIASEKLKQAMSAFGKIEDKPLTASSEPKAPENKPDINPPPPKQDDEIRFEPLPDIKPDPKPQPPADVKTPKSFSKVLMMVAEQNIDSPYPQYWWKSRIDASPTFSEKVMNAKLTEKGFSLVEHPNGIADPALRVSVMYQADIDNGDALKVGRVLKAELVIAGKTIVYAAPGTSSDRQQSFSATVTARVIRTDTGEQIASTMQTALVPSKDEVAGTKEALEKASTLAMEDLASQISAASQSKAAIPPDTAPPAAPSVMAEWIDMSVIGSANIGNFIRFRRGIGELQGVRELKVIESKGNEAKLSVSYEGSFQQFTDLLKKTDFQLFNIVIRETFQNKIKLELMPKP